MNPGLPTLTPQNTCLMVVGDVMLDRYWYGNTHRISPEAPVPVVHVQQQDERPGGAANVALNIRTLGAHTLLLGTTGLDEEANSLSKKLHDAKIECHFQIIKAPTTTKLRLISQQQQLIRIDFEQSSSTEHLHELLTYFDNLIQKTKLLVLSDYNKGVLRYAPQFIQKARKKNISVIVDPKGHDFSIYRDATLLTPNKKEFEIIVGPCQTQEILVRKAKELIEQLNLTALLITEGAQGMTLVQKNLPHVHFPAHQHEVFDVTGAGDTVIATLAVAMALGYELEPAVYLSNVAAGIAVTKLGNATITFSELQKKMAMHESIQQGIVNGTELQTQLQSARIRGERIIMTNGCFDILHAGHVTYLNQAKALGDRLIVAVNDDFSVKRLKGSQRPINSLEKRMKVLSALSAVDWVIPFAEDTPERLISSILPDVLVKGGDYCDIKKIPGAACVLEQGGEVKLLHHEKDCSTTALIESLSKITS